MRNYFITMILSILAVSTVNAFPGKAEACPSVNAIKIQLVSKPWTHRYIAYNDDGKYFISKEYTEDYHNGPAPILDFINSEYDASTKTLSCIYYAFTRSENSHPVLVNIGDY